MTYRGAAWYADGDCIFGCHLTGNFTLRKGGGAPTFGGISATLSGDSGWAGHTFDVDSGHYQMAVGVRKEGGYWRNQGNISSSEIQMNTLGQGPAVLALQPREHPLDTRAGTQPYLGAFEPVGRQRERGIQTSLQTNSAEVFYAGQRRMIFRSITPEMITVVVAVCLTKLRPDRA